MGVRDVLWGCPLCGTVAGIRAVRRREVCVQCGATYRRGDGASIIVRRDGVEQARTAAEWERDLPEPHFAVDPATGAVLGPETVRIRFAREERPLHHAGEFLGWIERFGAPVAGRLILREEELRFDPTSAADACEAFRWPLDRLRVVQPASSALQVAAGTDVASIRFTDSSARLWTRALVATLRGYHGRRGRELVELQPVIRTRALVGKDRR